MGRGSSPAAPHNPSAPRRVRPASGLPTAWRVTAAPTGAPRPGVVNHLRAGPCGQHGGHIVGKVRLLPSMRIRTEKASFQRQPPSTARRALSVAAGKQACTCRNTSSRDRPGRWNRRGNVIAAPERLRRGVDRAGASRRAARACSGAGGSPGSADTPPSAGR